MAVVDPQNFLNEFVPTVHISKILLETSGDTLIVDNPHIDSSKENFSLLEQKNKSDKSLKVTINLIVNEKITDDNIATWFDKNEIIKYIEIKLFQSTDSRLTEILSSGIDMLDLIDPNKTVSPDDLRYIYAGYIYDTNELESLNQKFLRHSSLKKMSLNKLKNLNNSVDEFKSYVDDAGNQIYEITYVATFIIPHEFPSHLAYFALSSFNIEELSKDYKLKLDSSNLENLLKKTSSDIVIENAETVGKTFIFYDRNGQIWSGPTIQSENGNWFTGVEINELSKPLVRSVVNNSKVQDNRSFKKLSSNIESLFNKYLNNNITKISANTSTVPTKKEVYFSELMLARGKDGDSKFLFAINIDKLITEKSIYGNLIKTSKKLRDEILKNCTIKSLTLYRRRVKQDGKNYNIFDLNEPVDYIINSRDSSANSFININNNRASLRESFILTNNEKQYLRYFTGVDKTMSDVTTGIYQYYADLEIEDGTIDYVQSQIELLSLARVELQKYYEIAAIPGTTKIKLEIQDPHIQHPSETASSKQYQAPYYDLISNQFTQEFERLMKQKYPTDNLLLAPWISAVSVYVTVLDIFTDFLDNVVQRQKYLKDLHSAVSPSTGNLQGIMTVIGLIDNLTNILSKSIGITTTISPRKFGAGSEKLASFSRSARETIKVKKIFNEIFDSEIAKDYAYDYLSLGEDDTKNDDGIRVINGDDFNERITAETLKNFNSPEDSLNINFAQNNILLDDSIENTNFTYITPTRIDTPKKSYVLSTVSKKIPKETTISKEEQKLPVLNVKTSVSTSTSSEQAQKETIFKPKPPKKQRIVENINESPENKENKLSKIKSEIIFSSVIGIASIIDKKETQDKKTVVSKKELKKTQENNNINQTDDNYAKILSVHSSAVLEKNFVRKRSPPRVLKKDFVKDIKKSNVNLPVKDKVEKNVSKEITKNNPSKLLDLLVKPLSFVKGFDKKEIKKSGNPNANRKKLITDSVINVKSTELKASKDYAGRNIIEGLRKPITEQKFKKLPNHVKKIFVKNEKTPPPPTPSISPKPSEIFDYALLNKIQYLESFETNEFGDVMLSEPVWKDLTKSDYKSKVGKELLCRMKKYEDADVGIEKIPALEKPYYDEVFILVPETIDEQVFQIKPIKIENKKITEEIIKSVQLAIPGIQFVETTPTAVSQPTLRTRLRANVASERPKIVSTITAEPTIKEESVQISDKTPITTINIKQPSKETGSRKDLLPTIKLDNNIFDKIPDTLTIIQTNNIGQQITKKFELSDKSSIINAIESVPKNTAISLNNVNVTIPVKAASEIVALDSQSNLVKPSLTSNNQISSIKMADQVKQEIKSAALVVQSQKTPEVISVLPSSKSVVASPVIAAPLSKPAAAVTPVQVPTSSPIGKVKSTQSSVTNPSNNKASVSGKPKTSPIKK